MKKMLELVGLLWQGHAQQLVDGPILRTRSGRLYRSFGIEGPKEEMGGLSLTLRNTAKNPATDFPYAAFHEYASGKAFIRPALGYILQKDHPGFHMIQRGAAADSIGTLSFAIAEHGWQPTIKRNHLVKIVKIDMAGRVYKALGPTPTRARQRIIVGEW